MYSTLQYVRLTFSPQFSFLLCFPVLLSRILESHKIKQFKSTCFLHLSYSEGKIFNSFTVCVSKRKYDSHLLLKLFDMPCLFPFSGFVIMFFFSVPEIDCGKPLVIPHTEIIWDNSTTLLSRVFYKCKQGYYFNGERNYSECTLDQKWESITYICKGKYYCRKFLSRHKINCCSKHIKICVRNNNYFCSVFLLTEEELFSNLTIFNETCVKWQIRTGRLGVQKTYTVSGAVFETERSLVLVNFGESLLEISSVGFFLYGEFMFRILGRRWDEKTFSEDVILNITVSEDNPKVCLDLNSGSNYVVNITTISSTNIPFLSVIIVSTVKEAFSNVLIFNDTCLKWRRNVRGADMEDRYLFHVKGQRWYQKEFLHEMTFNLTTRKQTPEVCFDLLPGTNYSINISMVALNFSLVTKTSLAFACFLDPPFPDIEFVAAKGSAPLLRLRKAEDRNGPISLYQVIVLPLGLQSTFVCDSFATATFFSNTTDAKGYVAAEFRAKDVADNMSVALGDRLYYGKFYNAPLKLGQEYCVFLRIISEWNKVMSVIKKENVTFLLNFYDSN
uniref:Sushi domain-containing protein n=1 Tax=Pavo cristatus TaxID=9049 RepID=A0A8C9FZB9_PAVCR